MSEAEKASGYWVDKYGNKLLNKSDLRERLGTAAAVEAVLNGDWTWVPDSHSSTGRAADLYPAKPQIRARFTFDS